MANGMTNAQYNASLETIAKRLEEKKEPLTPEEAAKIVRESKTTAPIETTK